MRPKHLSVGGIVMCAPSPSVFNYDRFLNHYLKRSRALCRMYAVRTPVNRGVTPISEVCVGNHIHVDRIHTVTV